MALDEGTCGMRECGGREPDKAHDEALAAGGQPPIEEVEQAREGEAMPWWKVSAAPCSTPVLKQRAVVTCPKGLRIVVESGSVSQCFLSGPENSSVFGRLSLEEAQRTALPYWNPILEDAAAHVRLLLLKKNNEELLRFAMEYAAEIATDSAERVQAYLRSALASVYPDTP